MSLAFEALGGTYVAAIYASKAEVLDFQAPSTRLFFNCQCIPNYTAMDETIKLPSWTLTMPQTGESYSHHTRPRAL